MLKYSRTIALTALLVIANTGGLVPQAYAQALSSSLQFKVGKLANNIEKLRKRLATEGRAAIADDFKAKQLLDRINSYGAGLDKMPSEDDPVLMKAKQAYASLVADFNNLANSTTPAQQQPSTTTEAAAGSATAATPSPSGSSVSSGTSSGASATDAPQLVSGQRVRLKKLVRNLASARADITTTGPSALQDASVVKRYQAAMQKYSNELSAYSAYKADPDVIAAAREYQALHAALSAEFKRAKAQIADLGDVQGILASIEASLQSSVVAKMMWKPFGDSDAMRFVETISKTKAVASAAIIEIQRIAPNARLETNNPGTVQQGAPYDRNDMNRLLQWADSNIKKSDEALLKTRQQLDAEFAFQDQHELEYFRKMDPDIPKYRANAFLSEGAEARIYNDLDRQLTVPTSLASLQRAMDGAVAAEVQARIDEIAGLRKLYAENRVKAIGDSKLPNPVSGDENRMAIAAQILSIPRYEFGEHGPVVLTTADIITRTKTVNRDTIKDVDVSLSGDITWSGTRETWNYDWDEFKFATPIKHENGDWYIWWVTAKYYRSGASSTPINQWVSGATTQGSLILQENFQL